MPETPNHLLLTGSLWPNFHARQSRMRIRPHIEARGRPKHTSTLWPSKIDRTTHETTTCMYMRKQRTFQLQGKHVLTWKHHSLKEELVVLEILLSYLSKMRRKRSVKESTGAIEIDLGEYQSEEGVLSPKICWWPRYIYCWSSYTKGWTQVAELTTD